MTTFIQTKIIAPVSSYVRNIYDYWNNWDNQGTNWEATTRTYESFGD